MSALDQALIKAYDKPTARASAAAADSRPADGSPAAFAPREAGPARASAMAIERLYHEGGLYRVDRIPPAAAQGARAAVTNDQAGLVGPHFLLPPPTSPKRGVRRSILRLLSHQQLAAVAPDVEREPPRVRRKVIIRHVAHGGAVPPHHLMPLRAADASLPEQLPTDDATGTLADLQEMPPAIEIHGHWEASLASAENLVVVQDSADPRFAACAELVNLQLEALPDHDVVDAEAADEPLPETFVAKSLDDERQANIRADQAHARGPKRPHLQFGGAKSAPQLSPADDSAPVPIVADDVDLGPSPGETKATGISGTSRTAKQAIPVWEVDRFHWPRTCEKLLADERGYLRGAGEKLAAAVADGLKTLAITGSRRGEGRTTLALCLARVAARAGIQVALVDGDFARPTLATRLGLDVAHGWQDAALGQIPLSEAAIRSLADNITVLPLEVSAAGRALTLADPRVTATLRAAVATFELVIIDLGPLGPGERMMFPPGEACPLDATIVVRDLRFAAVAESQDVGERLYDAGIEAVGIAENFVDEEMPARSA
jgi:Mrp family chromosome partitioning ATPase